MNENHEIKSQQDTQTLDNPINVLQRIEARVLNTFINYSVELMPIYSIDSKIFLFEQHKDIWELIVKHYEKYKETNFLRMCVDAQDIGLSVYEALINIVDGIVTKETLDNDIKFLDNEYRKRQLKEIVFSEKEDFDDYLLDIASINNYYNSNVNGELLSEEEIFNLVTSNDETIEYTEMSFMNLFRITWNTFNVIASRTGEGKTAISLRFAYDLSEKYKVLYFNLENPKALIYKRLVSAGARLTKKEMIDYKENENNWKIEKSIKKLKSKKLKLYDATDAPNFETIRKIVKLEAKKERCIVFIDNLNDVRVTSKFFSIRERMDFITKEIINLKGSTDCIIFGLAQIKRLGDKKQPSLDDLKESGSLEEDADNVFMLSNMSGDKFISSPKYKLFTPKTRDSNGGQIYLVFEKMYQSFREVTIEERLECENLES